MNVKRFRYISYWGTWRRWLGEGKDGLTYEVELTPVNPSHSESWARMGIRIFASKVHMDEMSHNDKIVHLLPAHIIIRMCENLGVERAKSLLLDDFFSQIDFNKFRELNNGGADFDQIGKDWSDEYKGE
jgi:hypothetical protein